MMEITLVLTAGVAAQCQAHMAMTRHQYRPVTFFGCPVWRWMLEVRAKRARESEQAPLRDVLALGHQPVFSAD